MRRVAPLLAHLSRRLVSAAPPSMPTPCYHRMSYQVFLLSDNVQHGLQRVSTSIPREHGQNGEQHQGNRKWNPTCSLTPFICLRRADNQFYPSAALLRPSFFLPWPSWPFSPLPTSCHPEREGSSITEFYNVIREHQSDPDPKVSMLPVPHPQRCCASSIVLRHAV